MKKMLTAAVITMSFMACQENVKKEEIVTTTTTEIVDKTDPTVSQPAYMMREQKLVRMENGEWVAVTETVTLPGGTVIMTNGDVKNKDGVTVRLVEGEGVDNDGVVIRRGDNILQDVGDGIKKGANEAGNAIEKGANKTGEAIEKGAKKTGDAVKEGFKEAKQGVRKAGQEVKEVVN